MGKNKKSKAEAIGLVSNKRSKLAPKEDVQEVSISTKFAVDVAKHVIQQRMANGESVVCSPVSIDAILSILAAGAENSTLEQLLTLLGRGDVEELNVSASKLADVLKVTEDKDAPQVSFVNALWLDQRYSLKPTFQKVLKDVHNAQARTADFVNKVDQVVKEVNSWAAQVTKGLIKQILNRDNIGGDGNDVLLLANAIHFKGKWQKYFESINTKDNNFNLLNGEKVIVPMMNQWGTYFEYGTSDECQVLKMPYKIGKSSTYRKAQQTFSMYVFLPRESDGLPNLMEKIKIDEELFKDQFNLESVKIKQVSFPKFKFECNLDLKEPMKQLGLTLPFEENCKDFSGITDTPDPVYVNKIAQKCVVETDERGTVTAAVTEAYKMRRCGPPSQRPPPIKFVADHPFMFMIIEDVSGTMLFIGTVLDPR